jgi:hypothetical protein
MAGPRTVCASRPFECVELQVDWPPDQNVRFCYLSLSSRFEAISKGIAKVMAFGARQWYLAQGTTWVRL